MSDNQSKRKRRARGEYYTTPASSPERDASGPYWIIDGITLSGKRIRKVRRVYEAVRLLRNGYEEADNKYRKEHEPNNVPTIIVSKKLDEARVAEAERALALLPKLKDSQLPDPNAHLDDGIEFALKCGWDPLAGSVTIAELSTDLVKDLNRRASLEWEEAEYLSPLGLVGALFKQKWAVNIFGSEVLSQINSREAQRSILNNSTETFAHKKAGMLGLSQLLHFLVKAERLGVARVHQIERIKRSRPKAMSIAEQQAYLDEFWPTVFAACAVARLFLGIRPWSETKKSIVKGDPIFGLSPNYRTFHVPEDGKTGWRRVAVPPVAQLLFRILDEEGRLSREKDPQGNFVIYAGHKGSWTNHYANLGYNCGNNTATNKYMARGYTEERAREFYRNRYPMIHKRGFTPDYPRKTAITAYLVVSDGDFTRAGAYHGNGQPVIKDHYNGDMSPAEAFLHYRLVPTVVRQRIDINTIALPQFVRITLKAEDQIEYDKLVAGLTPGRPKGVRAHHPKQIEIILGSPEKIRDSIAKNPNKVRHINEVNETARNNSLRRVYKQLQCLAQYCKDHPEGFLFRDIPSLLRESGLECPGGRHGARWIFTFSNEKGMYYFKSSGSGLQRRYTLVNELPKVNGHGHVLVQAPESVRASAP